MSRKLRIQYDGAVYHVISRGNGRNLIFLNDRDRQAFLAALGEACERTGWRIHAYVLMPNHYHLLVETPEPNLVAGMKWLQGTYTQRCHLRNGTCGHLFQGRYKAIPVSSENHYFAALSLYIHLNPVRARLREVMVNGLEAYPWSSYQFYIQHYHPAWLETKRVLNASGFSAAPRGRLDYQLYVNRRVSEISTKKGAQKSDSEWKQIQRGWYYGNPTFRRFLVRCLKQLPGKRESYSGEAAHKHDEHEAENLLKQALEHFGTTLTEIQARKHIDSEKCLIAWLIRRRTTVPNQWICQKLKMGRVDCFSRYPRLIETNQDRQIVKMRKQLDENTRIRD